MRKYLKIYENSMQSGHITDESGRHFCGLCPVFGCNELFDLFAYGHACWYWGYEGEEYKNSWEFPEIVGTFTPLRQNIVLFMAAMNNEL